MRQPVKLFAGVDQVVGGVVVNVCSFYEWPETGRSSKSPTYSKLKNGSLMVMAGLWDHPAAGQEADTFAIVTVESNAKLLAVCMHLPTPRSAPSAYESFSVRSITSVCHSFWARQRMCVPGCRTRVGAQSWTR